MQTLSVRNVAVGKQGGFQCLFLKDQRNLQTALQAAEKTVPPIGSSVEALFYFTTEFSFMRTFRFSFTAVECIP